MAQTCRAAADFAPADVSGFGPDSQNSPSDEWRTSWLERFTFSWLAGIEATGAAQPLQQHHVGRISRCDAPSVGADSIIAQLPRVRGERVTRRALWRALLGSTRSWLAYAGVCKFIGDAFGYAQPLCIAAVVGFVQRARDEPPASRPLRAEGGYYAAIMLVSAIMQTLMLHNHHHAAIRAGLFVRSSVLTLVYRKMLRLSARARQSASLGQLATIQAADSTKIMMVFYFVHYAWAAPLQLIVTLVLLYQQLGLAALAGFAAFLLFVPLQLRLSKMLARVSQRVMEFTDRRTKAIAEIVQGIRIIKFYAWERSFSERVADSRRNELRRKAIVNLLEGINGVIIMIGPLAMALVAFVVFSSAMGEQLTAQRAFSSLAFFDILRLPLMTMNMLISSVATAMPSVDRLANLLSAEELDDYVDRSPPSAEQPAAVAISGSFAWPATAESESPQSQQPKPQPDAVVAAASGFELRDLSLTFPTGSLTTIMGKVGSGKSSLLFALLGELERKSGSARLGGTVSYCAQTPWIFNASLRANVLFGRPMDAARYARVLRVCALETDIAMLPKGDDTEIGERGINLSGGQKARVGIARAVYADADIVLLDDVLSAVDAHVAQHIFEHCIMGELRTKTRVFASHQVQFAGSSDQLIVLEGGAVVASGRPADVPADLMAQFQHQSMSVQGADAADSEPTPSPVSPASPASALAPTPVPTAAPGSATPAPAAADKSSAVSGASQVPAAADKAASAPAASRGKLIVAEDRETGEVRGSVFSAYFGAAGWTLSTAFLLFSLVKAVLQVLTDVWLSRWSNGIGGETLSYYLGGYIGFLLSHALSMLLLQLALVAAAFYASQKLHADMMRAILRAPMSFFDTTPVGRLISRFSTDVDGVDKPLVSALGSAAILGMSVLAVLVMQATIFPWLLLAFGPAAMCFWAVQSRYGKSSRELKRLDSISNSPIFAHLTESAGGLSTLRAYGAQDRFRRQNEGFVAVSAVTKYKLNATNRWLGVRLEFISAILIFTVAMVAVLTYDGVESGLVGLCLSYAAWMTSSLNWLVRAKLELDSNMTSVERVMFMARVPSEAPEDSPPADKPPQEWPRQGAISIRDLTMRYRAGLDPVLRGVSLEIRGGEKVGVVGRTGAGKSSLMLALFRIVEASEGSVLLDGVDISRVGLRDLRSKLAIIPQDPVLFRGTLRENLDPFNEFSDAAVWEALERVQLRAKVSAEEAGLSALVSEGGENFSVGQRQLLCMARAILRRSKVLVLDEATASIDAGTDHLIQQMVRETFKDCTVLTIAHRIGTILDSDRVLVLDAGRVAEFDSPRSLLANDSSMFAQLKRSQDRAAEDAGTAAASRSS